MHSTSGLPFFLHVWGKHRQILISGAVAIGTAYGACMTVFYFEVKG
jgi:hypothetical protein